MSTNVGISIAGLTLAVNLTLLFSPSCSRADEKTFPAENDIFVIGMADLDQMEKCGANVTGWFGGLERPEQEKWMGRCVEFARRHHLPLVMSLSIFDASWETYQQRPDLVAACCKDIEGNPIIVDWETQSPDKPMYWGCTNNPTYRQFWIEVAKRNVDLGAQGIIADEMQGTSGVIGHDGGCYCECCEKGFREYLRAHCDAETLKKHDIDDLDTFSYGDLIRDKVSSRREEVMKLVRQKKTPMIGEYTQFQREASREYLRQLVQETKQYALDKHNRRITFSANTYDLSPSTLYYLDLLDYFTVETPYTTRYGYPPHRRVLPYLRISEALGKPSIALLCIHSGADFVQRGGLPNLQRLHIAEAYASGNNTFLPDGVYAWSKETGPDKYVGDLDAMAPTCRFVRGSDFYTGSRSWGARIGLLYRCDSALKSWPYWNSFAGTCWVLDDAHVPFDVIISGDGELVKTKLDLDKLRQFDLIVLSGGAELAADEEDVLGKFIQAGGRVIWMGGEAKHALAAAGATITPDVGAERFKEEKPEGSEQIVKPLKELTAKVFDYRGPSRCTVLPRALPDGTIAVHLLNFDYDVNADKFTPAPRSSLRIRPGKEFERLGAAFLTPEGNKSGAVSLNWADGWLDVGIPEFDAYAVLLVGEHGSVTESTSRTEGALARPLVKARRMKLDRKADDWQGMDPTLPNGIKVFLDLDGLYFYVPDQEGQRIRSVVFEIDTDGDGQGDLSYYGDGWGGAVTKIGGQAEYMGRGRAARCKGGVEFRIPGGALPLTRSLRVRMTRLNNEKQTTEWIAVEAEVSGKQK